MGNLGLLQRLPETFDRRGVLGLQRGKIRVEFGFGDPLPVAVKDAEGNQRKSLHFLFHQSGRFAFGCANMGFGDLTGSERCEKFLV